VLLAARGIEGLFVASPPQWLARFHMRFSWSSPAKRPNNERGYGMEASYAFIWNLRPDYHDVRGDRDPAPAAFDLKVRATHQTRHQGLRGNSDGSWVVQPFRRVALPVKPTDVAPDGRAR
jgi:hypothetical protein